MSEAATAPQCTKPDCQVAVTGQCLDGLDNATCPNFTGTDAMDEDLDTPAADASQPVQLPSGLALTPDDVEAFARWREPTFVAIVGDSFSGKTTLVCALYDRFLRAPFAGLSFAGSRTLMALEERSHYSRVESGLTLPDTVRTSIADGLRYFHLSVTASPSTKPIEFLLSDRAGELYQQARANSDRVKDLTEIARAHRVVILIDGGRLANPEERASALQGARQMLRALVDNDALDARSNIQIVTTKWDLVEASVERDAIGAALTAFQTRLSADFCGRVAMLTYWNIASRDPTTHMTPAYGLDALLADWATPPVAMPVSPAPPLDLTSEFDRLLVRTPEVAP